MDEVSFLSAWKLSRLEKLTVVIQVATFIGRNLLQLLDLLLRKRWHGDHLRWATRSEPICFHLLGFKECLLFLLAHAFPLFVWDSVQNLFYLLLHFLP